MGMNHICIERFWEFREKRVCTMIGISSFPKIKTKIRKISCIKKYDLLLVKNN